MTGPLPTPPDIVRCAYVELQVRDLPRSRAFYVDLLGLHVTREDAHTLFLRTREEFLHHNLVLREGPLPAAVVLAFRVRTPADVDAAQSYYRAMGCRTQRRGEGFLPGIGDAIRVQDPLGFPYEFFHDATHVERLTRRYELAGPTTLLRLDHVNLMTPRVTAGRRYLEGLGFRVSEDIRDAAGVEYAVWLHRTQTVHDTALTAGDGPRLHHLAFAVPEQHHILALCDTLGARRWAALIERGPGRHGVSNAFYLYLRDPDGHRVELYTQDYYTGDPDNPVVSWDVHDEQRRDWWANPVVPSWYSEASPVLDLDGAPQPVLPLTAPAERSVTVGADGFSYTTAAGQGLPPGGRE